MPATEVTEGTKRTGKYIVTIARTYENSSPVDIIRRATLFIRRWQSWLGLQDWEIYARIADDLENCRAELARNNLLQSAILYIDKAYYRGSDSVGDDSVPPPLEQTIIHELIHLIHGDMHSHIVETVRTVMGDGLLGHTVYEQLKQLEERTADRMAISLYREYHARTRRQRAARQGANTRRRTTRSSRPTPLPLHIREEAEQREREAATAAEGEKGS